MTSLAKVISCRLRPDIIMPSPAKGIIMPPPAKIWRGSQIWDAHLPNHILQLVPAIRIGPHRPNLLAATQRATTQGSGKDCNRHVRSIQYHQCTKEVFHSHMAPTCIEYSHSEGKSARYNHSSCIQHSYGSEAKCRGTLNLVFDT
jgi:hypothetical protein